jgi:hypothetical protein
MATPTDRPPHQHEDPNQDPTIRDLAALTPGQLAAEVRADAAEVYARAQAWRASPQWTGDKQDRKAYDSIAVMIAELDALPEPATHHDVYRYVNAVHPVLGEWWPDHRGPQYELHHAVERLRRTAMHRISWASNARRILGQE